MLWTPFVKGYFATLGSILDSQLSWESGKFQIARFQAELKFPSWTECGNYSLFPDYPWRYHFCHTRLLPGIWEYCKLYLARWSHRVALFLPYPDQLIGCATDPNTKHGGCATDPPFQQLMFEICAVSPPEYEHFIIFYVRCPPLLSLCSKVRCSSQ